MNKIQTRLVKFALRKLKGNPENFKHISLIVYRGRILSWGMNSRKTHPKGMGPYHYIHSELAAVLKFKFRFIDLSDTILYNIRVGKSGLLLNSKPCKKCQKLIGQIVFKNVYFSNNGKLEQWKNGDY